MLKNKIIECTYGKHLCSENEFTPSGLNKKYFTQCRNCKSEEMRRYRQKHKEEYNNKVRGYQREYMIKWREKKNTEIEITN